MDLRYKVIEKNKLWLRWSNVSKVGDGRIELLSAEMFGPVTQDYLPLEQKAELKLDFTNHFLLLVPSFYIVELSWESIRSQEVGSIKFDKIILHDQNVGLMDKIKSDDLLLIDCTGHTEEDISAGNYKLVFDTMLYKEGKEPYDFTEK